MVLGSAPGDTSTSTSTGKASIPNNENVFNFASMPVSAHKNGKTERGDRF